MDSEKWDKTAHAKSYAIDTSPNCTEYFFQYDLCSSFLIQCYFKKNLEGYLKLSK